jgi:hypothetical protein
MGQNSTVYKCYSFNDRNSELTFKRTEEQKWPLFSMFKELKVGSEQKTQI